MWCYTSIPICLDSFIAFTLALVKCGQKTCYVLSFQVLTLEIVI